MHIGHLSHVLFVTDTFRTVSARFYDFFFGSPKDFV
jgi:hypothetical protein